MSNTILSLLTQLTESRNPEAPRGAEDGVPNDCGKKKTQPSSWSGMPACISPHLSDEEGRTRKILPELFPVRTLLLVSPSTSRDWEMVAEAANSTSPRLKQADPRTQGCSESQMM